MKQSSKIRNFAQVIEAWPKQTELAHDLDVSRSQVNMWKLRALDNGKIIPPEYWNTLVAAARRRKIKGITLGLLADLAEKAHPPIR